MKFTIIIRNSLFVFCVSQVLLGQAYQHGGGYQSYGIVVPPSPLQDLYSSLPEEYIDFGGVPIPPEITSFHIQSDIKYRYSRTRVVSSVTNKDRRGQEVVFSVVLPETAFISRFILVIDDTPYEAYVKEKDEAWKDYDIAKTLSQSAGLVEKSTRNSNLFNVNVNIQPYTNITFYLTYEQLLTRRLGQYEQAIVINPTQISQIQDYKIVVNIEESRDLSFVRVLNLTNNFCNCTHSHSFQPGVLFYRPAPNQAVISWSPTISDQRKLDTEGRFIVQYDVQRNTDAGDILIMQGYFVHFFAPQEESTVLPVIPKHVVFILDVSGSMKGSKLLQLKDSLNKILEDLAPSDYFNIIIFGQQVRVWIPKGSTGKSPLPATPENINKAKASINSIRARGTTNIHNALIKGLNLTARFKQTNILPNHVKPIIFFLTDGKPTTGETSSENILTDIVASNRKTSLSIYTLGFGFDVDFEFLKQLSLQNNGFARKIYEASDAPLQLQGFYKEIAFPLLTNVKFKYTSPGYTVGNLTVTKFSSYSAGTEIAVSGRLTKNNIPIGEPFNIYFNPSSSEEETESSCSATATVKGYGKGGFKAVSTLVVSAPRENCQVQPSSPEDQFLERLWAYLKIQQLLDKSLAAGNSKMGAELKAQAMEVALTYGFVTPLTSLVVVKPDTSDVINVIPSDLLSAGHLPSGGPINSMQQYQSREQLQMASNRMTSLIPLPRNINLPQQIYLGLENETLSLEDITWLGIYDRNVNVNGTHYKINRLDQLWDTSGYQCLSQNLEVGTCQHLKDCVLLDFLVDFGPFHTYFCQIEDRNSPEDLYAGVCCPD